MGLTLFRPSIVCAVCLLLARNGAAEIASEVPQAEQAETHAEKGLQLAQTGNLQLAEEELRKAVAMAPASPGVSLQSRDHPGNGEQARGIDDVFSECANTQSGGSWSSRISCR